MLHFLAGDDRYYRRIRLQIEELPTLCARRCRQRLHMRLKVDPWTQARLRSPCRHASATFSNSAWSIVLIAFFLRVVAALEKRSMTVPDHLDWTMNAFRCSPVGLFGFSYSFALWFAFSRHLLSALDLVEPRASIRPPRNTAYAWYDFPSLTTQPWICSPSIIGENSTAALMTYGIRWLLMKQACRHDSEQ